MITTTLNKIREHQPCQDGWVKLNKHLGVDYDKDAPINIIEILNNNGLDDAIWCLRAVDNHKKEIRKFTCDCALMVKHLWDMPKVIETYLKTQSKNLRLDAYTSASYAATATAATAANAATAATANAAAAAATATAAAADASYAAVSYASYAAAGAASYAAADASYAAADAASYAANAVSYASYTAGAAAAKKELRDKQEVAFRKMAKGRAK